MNNSMNELKERLSEICKILNKELYFNNKLSNKTPPLLPEKEEYFGGSLLNFCILLTKVIDYFKENNLELFFEKENQIDYDKFIKFLFIQLIKPSKKENRPKNKLVKLNMLEEYKEFWVRNNELRDSLCFLFSASIFKTEVEKAEEIGRQKQLAELSMNDDYFFDMNKLLERKENNKKNMVLISYMFMFVNNYLSYMKKDDK